MAGPAIRIQDTLTGALQPDGRAETAEAGADHQDADVLGERGYRTASFGKLHFSPTGAPVGEGRIVLGARVAQVEGESARLQSGEGRAWIDLGKDTNAVISWDYKPTRWGMYDVALVYAREGKEDVRGSALEFQLPGQQVTKGLAGTGGAQAL